MHCILHIGTEKTGTTTLQRWIRENRDGLADHGVYVPSSFGQLEHVHLVSFGAGNRRFFSPLARAGITTPAQRNAFRVELRERFEEELSGLADDTTVLLTSERCISNLQKENEVDRLVSMLESFFDEITVVAYLRPQHDLCSSLYSTALKNGFVDWEILPSDESSMPLLDYYASLDRWAQRVGVDNVNVRLYDRSELEEGDISTDFVTHVLQMDMNDFEPVPNQNESLSLEAQLFLLKFNEVVPRFEGETLSKKRANIGKLLSGIEGSKGILPTEAEAREFFSRFAESNEAVRATFLPHRDELFAVDFSKYPSAQPDHGLTEDDAFRIFGELWSAKQGELAHLQAKNKKRRSRKKRSG